MKGILYLFRSVGSMIMVAGERKFSRIFHTVGDPVSCDPHPFHILCIAYIASLRICSKHGSLLILSLSWKPQHPLGENICVLVLMLRLRSIAPECSGLSSVYWQPIMQEYRNRADQASVLFTISPPHFICWLAYRVLYKPSHREA